MLKHADATRREFLALAGRAAVAGTVSLVTSRPAEAPPAMLAAAQVACELSSGSRLWRTT